MEEEDNISRPAYFHVSFPNVHPHFVDNKNIRWTRNISHQLIERITINYGDETIYVSVDGCEECHALVGKDHLKDGLCILCVRYNKTRKIYKEILSRCEKAKVANSTLNGEIHHTPMAFPKDEYRKEEEFESLEGID